MFIGDAERSVPSATYFLWERKYAKKLSLNFLGSFRVSQDFSLRHTIISKPKTILAR